MAQRITVRMAATNAIHRAREAVDFTYHAAGATSIFDNHPLERRFRDIHTVTQHASMAPGNYAVSGRILLGLTPDRPLYRI